MVTVVGFPSSLAKRKRSNLMFKQGKVIIIIGTIVTIIASFMVPADINTKIINVLVILLFGVIAMGSSVLIERVYQKIYKKGNK